MDKLTISQLEHFDTLIEDAIRSSPRFKRMQRKIERESWHPAEAVDRKVTGIIAQVLVSRI